MRRIKLSNSQYSRIEGKLENIAIIETCENLLPKKQPIGSKERRDEVQDKVTKEIIIGFNGYVRVIKTKDDNVLYILYTERRFIPELKTLFKKNGVPFNQRRVHHFSKIQGITKSFIDGKEIK